MPNLVELSGVQNPNEMRLLFARRWITEVEAYRWRVEQGSSLQIKERCVICCISSVEKTLLLFS